MANIINAFSYNHKQMMKRIADVTEADSIRYEDLGNGENYTITKNGKSVVLMIRGNKIDGGFLSSQ